MDEQNFPNIFEEPQQSPRNNLPSQKRLEKSKTNVIIAGICSGVAKYLNIEPAIIRLLVLLSLLLGAWIIAVYFIAVFLIPQEKDNYVLTGEEKQIQKKINFRTVAGGLLMLTGFHMAFVYFGIITQDNLLSMPYGYMFPFIAVAAGAYFLGAKENESGNQAEKFPDKFFRSRSDRLLMGVCGGFAKYINAESYTVRVVFVLATLFTFGFFAVIYFLFSLTVKLDNPEIASQQ